MNGSFQDGHFYTAYDSALILLIMLLVHFKNNINLLLLLLLFLHYKKLFLTNRLGLRIDSATSGGDPGKLHISCTSLGLCFRQGCRFQRSVYYRAADKSLARPGRKKATATKDFEFHISYL